ncbi:MAG: HAMP domain-containing protein [Oscillatoriophycideae cyanobacterium NC_groundwater_1537_Pr4_S-0.65um_50_18]|nr:HAMP domain-containing protein [Oscillatoriophycideae cyanobacterium NC_groundwater_1537_Pr4_S-0.65um_50_18]
MPELSNSLTDHLPIIVVNPDLNTPDLNTPASSPKLARIWGLSLRFKATLLAAAIGTLPLLTVGTAGYLAFSHLDRVKTEESEQRLATEIQIQLNQLMAERASDVQIIADLDIFADFDLRKATPLEQKNDVLDRFVKSYPIYDSIAAFDLEGNPIAQSKGKLLENHRDRPYIQDALRTQEPVLSQPMNSVSSGTFSVYAAAPIKDRLTGKVTGTVRLRIPVAHLTKLSTLLEGKRGSDYYLLNSEGKVFYSSVEQFPTAPSDGSPQAGNSAQSKTIETIFPAISSLRRNRQIGSLVTMNQLSKVKQLVSYIPPKKATGLAELNWKAPALNWSIVLATRTSVAFEAQRNQLMILLFGAGGSVILISIAAIYLAKRAIRPILNSATAVEKIGQGELTTRVQIQGSDEVATLGLNINRMADQIQGLLATLKQNADQIQHQNHVLAQLAQGEAVIQGNASAAALSFAEAIAQTLKVEQAGIWLYNSDRTALSCLGQYRLHEQTQGDVLQAEDLPQYFQALQADAIWMADIASGDAAMQELLAAKQVPLDTQSTVSLPIQLGSRTIGIIRCDQVQSPRIWQADEQIFLVSIANLLSIVLESDYLQQEVNHMLDVVSDAEEGNLAAQAHVSDRTIGLVADTFNRLIERFAQILNQVLDAARQVSAGATRQKQLVETVTVNARQQAEAIAQVLQLTEQVEQTAQDSAQNVKASSESLRVTCTTVAEGQAAIDTLTQEITTLQEGSDRIMQRMKTLGEFVGLADQFVQDQSQIAFVTQTLALNASLVAARASEQRDPRQFVVVAREFGSIADQVSKLAQQTNDGLTTIEQRSAQIHKVVAAVDSDVQGLGELVRRFNQGVEQSNQVFNQVQSVMATAVQVGDTVTTSNQEIVNATQSTAEAIRHIAELAAKNTNLTQQAQIQFEQMDVLSSQLLQSIQFFKLPASPQQQGNGTTADREHSSEPSELTLTVSAADMAVNPALQLN